MPSVSASVSLSSKAYSRVVRDVRATAPSLADREASATSLITELELELSREKEKFRRARLHYEVARLKEIVLRDQPGALQNYQKAHALDASFEPILAGFIRARAAAGQWEGTLGLFDEQIALTKSPEAKAGLYFCKAVINEQRLERPAEARSDYEKGLALVPDEPGLLRSVIRCAERDQDFKQMDQMLAVSAELCQKAPSLFGARLAERARVGEQLRKKTAEAAQYYAQAFDADPLSSSAAFALERLHALQKNAAEQAVLLSRRAKLITDARERSATLAAAGALFSDALGEPARAAQLVESAWRADPENFALLCELEELFRQLGDYANVVRVLRLREPSVQGESLAQLYLTIAEVLSERLSDKAEAARYYELAREISPANSASVGPLLAYYEETEAWGQLVQTLLEQEAGSKDDARRAQIHCHIARVCEQKLSSREDAIAHYKAALGLVPGLEEAFRESSRLLLRAKRYEEVVELHERAAEAATDTATCLVHLFRVGQILEDLMGDPGRALSVYQRILKKEPQHLGALFLVQRAAHSSGDHAALVAALLEEAGVRKDLTPKLALLHRAARVCHEVLGQEQRALQIYAQVVQLDPKHVATLEELISLHEAAGRHQELLKIFGLRLATLTEPSEKAALLCRMGHHSAEHLGAEEQALLHLKKALEVVPGYAPASLSLRRMYLRLGRFEELAAFLQDSLKKLATPQERAEAALLLGRVYEHRLGKLQNALGAYETAIHEDPDLVIATDAQLRVLEQRPELKKTTEALGARAAQAQDPTTRLWSALRQAELLESSGRDQSEAISVYERILRSHPAHPQALSALGRLYEKAGQGDALRKILVEQVAGLPDAASQIGALRDLLRVSEKDGTEPPVAGALPDVTLALLERAPSDRAALRLAEMSALTQGSPELLATVDAKYTALVTQPQLVSAHRTRLGEFLEPRNPVQALEQHRPALRLDEENIGAARGLTRVAEAIDDSALLIEAAGLEASVVRSPERAAGLLTRAAHLLSTKGEPDRAIEALMRALKVCPESLQAASALHDLLSERGRYEELITVLTEAAQMSTSDSASAEHWICVAKGLADQQGDVPAAIAALKRVDAASVKSLAACLELGELYVRTRQWHHAVEQFQLGLQLKPKVEIEHVIRARLAEIYHEQLSKLPEASRELRAILDAEPKHVAALQRLLVIQMKEGAQTALETAQTLASACSGPEKAEALLSVGKLLVKAGKQKEAIHPLAEAVSLIGLEPADASLELCKVLQKEDGGKESWAGYEKALLTFLPTSFPGEHQAKVYLELGRVLGEMQKRPDEAILLLLTGLEHNRNATALRADVVRRLKAQGRFKDALPEVMKLLQTGPLEPAIWTDLLQTYEGLGMNPEAHLATGALVFLGHGSELQRASYRAHVPRPAMAPFGSFNGDALAATLVQGTSLDAVALLSQISPLLSKVFPPSSRTLGISAKRKVGARGSHPCRQVLDRLCSIFGGVEIDIYPSGKAEHLSVVFTDPIGLVVPDAMGDLPEADQVFYLGRAVASIARGTHAVEALDLDQLRVLFAAAVTIVDQSVSVAKVPVNELAEVSKSLHKALPWLSRGRIEDAARRFAAAPTLNVELFRRQILLSGWRAGLLLADDLRPLARLQENGWVLAGISEKEIEPVVKDLLPFWAGASSVQLRRQLGLL